MRYCLFVDKLSMSIDILTGFLIAQSEDKTFPEDMRLQVLG
jgi:hypothetical protein